MSSASTPPPRSQRALYRLVQSDLQRQILSGDLQAGDWLPSEAALCREYGVSATSVRRALLELKRLRLVERYQGRGSVVTANEFRAVSPMLGLGRELRHRGFDVRPEVLCNDTEAADAEVAAPLGIDAGEAVRHIRRRYVADGEAMVLLDHYLVAQPKVDYSEFTGDSLYAFLAVRNALPAHAREQITAINLSNGLPSLLDVPEGQAVLMRERTSFSAEGQPVEFTRYFFRTDRYFLELDLEMQE